MKIKVNGRRVHGVEYWLTLVSLLAFAVVLTATALGIVAVAGAVSAWLIGVSVVDGMLFGILFPLVLFGLMVAAGAVFSACVQVCVWFKSGGENAHG